MHKKRSSVRRRRLLATAVVVMGALVGSLAMTRASEQDRVAKARELYVAADYDQALTVLAEVANRKTSDAVQRDANMLRLECLVAIGRLDEASQVVEQLMVQAPAVRTTDADMPPKTATFFRETRTRMLPRVAEQQYQSAKAALDAKRYTEAATQFTVVLTLLDENDVQLTEAGEAVSLRVRAREFRDLSAAHAK